MLYSGTDPESYITEYTLVYEEPTRQLWSRLAIRKLTSCVSAVEARQFWSEKEPWPRQLWRQGFVKLTDALER